MSFWEKEVVGMTLSQLMSNIIFSVVIMAVGIVLGIIIGYWLKRFLEKARIEKSAKYSFFVLFIAVIKWSIFLLFLSWALKELEVPQFTSWLTEILVVIPALTGALILITAGFAIASYLKGLIEDSKVEGWKILSKIFFMFILYVFMVFAFKTALISFDTKTVNILLIILTAVVSGGIVFWYFRKR